MRTMNRLRTSLLATVVAVGAGGGTMLAAPVVAQAKQKVAMVDLQKVLTSTQHGKRSQKKLEQEVKTRQQALDRQRAQLEADAAKLRNLKGNKLRAAQEQLQRQSVEWQQKAMSFETELAERETKMLEEIYGNVAKIVEKIAREQGLDMVLVKDQMSVIYNEPSLDITDQVIKRYDKAHK